MMVKYELKRIFTKRLNRLLLVAVLLIGVCLSVFAVTGGSYVDSSGVRHETPDAARRLAEDRNRWKGELTGEVLSEITSKWQELSSQYGADVPAAIYGQTVQSMQDIEFMINDILRGDGEYDDSAILNITPEQAGDLYAIREGQIENIIEEYGETTEQREFLREVYEKTDTPFYYEAAGSWTDMYTYATTYGIILVVLIGFLAAGIFSDEFTFRADAVFFSARYGRSKAVRGKILSGLLMATAIYWAGMLLLSGISFAVMGVSGFGTPYQIEFPYSIYNMTCGQEYLLIVLGGYIAALLSASVCMLTAAKTRSASIAVCVPFILFCASPFIARALPFDTFFQLTPDQLLNLLNCTRYSYLYQMGTLVFRQVPFVLLFYTLAAAALLPLVHRCYHRTGIRAPKG